MKVATARPRPAISLASLLILMLALVPACAAYSVLTHEEIIDLQWDQQIKPLLLARFPDATPDDLSRPTLTLTAAAWCRTSAIIPFGSSRVQRYDALCAHRRLCTSNDQRLAGPERICFCAGSALALHLRHQRTSLYQPGGRHGIPRAGQGYGPAVPYDVDHKAHLKTEFGFDVLQVAKGRYAPEDYHNFIGFEVSAPLLERAFFDTYGIKLSDVMPREESRHQHLSPQRQPDSAGDDQGRADGERRPVAAGDPELQPRSTSSITCRTPTMTASPGAPGIKKPGPGAHFMAGIFKVMPKVGPLQAVDFKEPTPKTERHVFQECGPDHRPLRSGASRGKGGDLQTPNIDLDTGKPTGRGEYPLADYTYREWLDELAEDHFNHMNQAMRQNILDFYQGFGPPEPGAGTDKCVAARWRKTETELNQLRAVALLDAPNQAPASAVNPTSTTAQAPRSAGCGK